MTYGAKTVIPLETRFPTLRTSSFTPRNNDELLGKSLDLEPVWIGCSQNLNARFRQNVICQIVWLHKISTFAFSKSRFFTFTKHYKALLFQRRRWANRYFFLQKIKIAPIRQEIPALSLPPCIPYRNLGWYRNASIPFRFKYWSYRSHSGNIGANTEFWIPDF